jgi:para-nitrobenzyl esterase
MTKSLVTLISATLLALCATPADAATDLVRTDAGPVRGTVHETYATYQDIPFAASPVGNLRWAPPHAPKPWSTPRDATQPSPRCAQTAGGGTPSDQEDCLYLNVTTPDTRGRKPVMVWFHGGGNSYGAAADFDAHRLAVGGDVVVVTTNFRQGVFSSFADSTLPGSGDFGLQDQQAALRWVQRNAATFGGDPRNVTIFGESGGAFDVCGQLTSPAAEGLFQRAIMNSGSCSTAWPANGLKHGSPAGSAWQPLSQAEADGAALAAKFGCSTVDCLRHVPTHDLVSGKDISPITPLAYGTRTLPEHPAKALAEGRFHRVPVLTGNTRDEGRLTGAFAPADVPYDTLLKDAYGSNSVRVAARYPVPGRLTWSTVLTDQVWTCNQLADAKQLAKRTPVYHYEFADRTAPTGFFTFPSDVPGGAFHSTDVPYLFDWALFPATFTPDQQRLSGTMIRFWSGFARTGWMPDSLSFAPDNIHPVDLNAEHSCDFWASLPTQVPAP